MQAITVRFSGSQQAKAVVVEPNASGRAVLAALRLRGHRGVVVLNGGTAGMSEPASDRLQAMLGDGLAAIATELNLTLLTGGTDAGLFRALGQALAERSGVERVVGVAPSELVDWPGSRHDGLAADRVPLEPHHTDFVLVDTSEWGGETDVMLDLARALDRRCPSVAVLASGGQVARREMVGHVRQGRPIVVLRGSGRLADDVAAAVEAGGSADDWELNEIVRRGRIVMVGMDEPPARLAAVIRQELARKTGDGRRRQPPALLRRMPRLRFRPPDPFRQFVDFRARDDYPLLAQDFVLLDDELMPAYRELDAAALRHQSRFHLVGLLYILGSFAATTLGAIQAAGVGDRQWVGLVETVLTGILGGGLLLSAAGTRQHAYFTNRLKAERLRSEYFLFLGRQGPYRDAADRAARLRQRVQAIRSDGRTGS